jgi:hypothetical protein
MLFNPKFFIISCAFLLMLTSCEKDFTSDIGGGLQPPNDDPIAKFDNTTVNLIAYTIHDSRHITSNRRFHGLGSYNSDVFGTVKMDLITQIFEANSDTIPNEDKMVSVDSIILMLIYHSGYPSSKLDELQPFTISLGELAEPELAGNTTSAKVYYSDDFRAQKDGGGTILRDWKVVPEFRDSIPDPNHTDTLTDPPMVAVNLHILRIPIYTEDSENSDNGGGKKFAEELLNASRDTRKLDSNRQNAFLERITGLYIESHKETTPNSGNIINFDWSGRDGAVPGILVYYTAKDTASTGGDTNVSRVKTYTIGTGFWDAMTYTYVEFDRDDASSNLTQQLDSNTNTEDRIALGDEMVYLQSFFSTLVRVEMPNIRDFTASVIDTNTHTIMINQASLVMCTSPNVHSPIGTFSPAVSLNVGRHFRDTTDENMPDSIVNILDHAVSVGGSYNSNKEEYRIFLTRHVQHLLLTSEEDAPNFPLTIRSNNRGAFPDITSIFGPNPEDPKKRMRLEIIYSVLPKN